MSASPKTDLVSMQMAHLQLTVFQLSLLMGKILTEHALR